MSVLSQAPPASPDYHLVHDRLTALERLTRLFELGALSAEEFAAEKALILALPADELVLRDPAPVSFVPAAPRRPALGPTLLGRLLGWKFLLFSLAAGVAFSFATQPAQTTHLFEQIAHSLGG
ncbi:MAG: SHOCT domain-containing protein [Sphingomonadaceae bacterium]|nr:SHOCT domain-containing protein [Sphingomonadaceae bacterium]